MSEWVIKFNGLMCQYKKETEKINTYYNNYSINK